MEFLTALWLMGFRFRARVLCGRAAAADITQKISKFPVLRAGDVI